VSVKPLLYSQEQRLSLYLAAALPRYDLSVLCGSLFLSGRFSRGHIETTLAALFGEK
jgi:hypothetical protein